MGYFLGDVTEASRWFVVHGMGFSCGIMKGFNSRAGCAGVQALRVGWMLVLAIATLSAGQNERRFYEVPAGAATVALRRLSEQSGREILFAAEAVRGVQTNAVRGNYTALEAATQMLAGTKLYAVQDGKTGALAVQPVKRPSPETQAPKPQPPG